MYFLRIALENIKTINSLTVNNVLLFLYLPKFLLVFPVVNLEVSIVKRWSVLSIKSQ